FLVNSSGSSGTLKWGEFIRLVNDDDGARVLRKVTLLGTSRISGEIDQARVEELKKNDPKAYERLKPILDKIPNGKFSVQKAQVEDPDLVKRLNKLTVENGLEYDQQDEHFAWLGAVLVMVLPAVVLLALFLFLLPRFRDPLGGGFLSNYIKSPAKRYERAKGRITFDDVAG